MNRHQECWRVSRVPGVHGKGEAMKNREVLRLRPLTAAQGEEVGLFLPLEVLDRRSGQAHQTMDVRTAGSRQFVEQPLRVFQVGGVEPLGK
jgi:hypothetical protein